MSSVFVKKGILGLWVVGAFRVRARYRSGEYTFAMHLREAT